MSKKGFSHIRGKRGQAFADRIRGIPSEQMMCVSLDVSIYFHVAMIHNGLGEILRPTFEVSFYQSGFDQLCQAIEQAKGSAKAQVVLVGMEPSLNQFGQPDSIISNIYNPLDYNRYAYARYNPL
jgi:hypothetical protein